MSSVGQGVELALRRRSADHPMAMFATLAGIALVTMAFSSSTLSLNDRLSEPALAAAPAKADARTSRLVPACKGVAWGAETAGCLRAIAGDDGRKTERIRIIASAEIDHQRPNTF